MKKPSNSNKRSYNRRRGLTRSDSEPSCRAINAVLKERAAEGLPLKGKEERAQIAQAHLTDSSNINYLYGEYRDLFTFSKKITSPTWAENLARDLVSWAIANPNAIKINEFLVSKGMYIGDFEGLFPTYPILKSAYEIAKSILGNTRERNILENKWNSSAGMYMMVHYDKDWKEVYEYKESVKAKNVSANNEQLLNQVKNLIEPAASTEEVRIKKEQDAQREARIRNTTIST